MTYFLIFINIINFDFIPIYEFNLMLQRGNKLENSISELGNVLSNLKYLEEIILLFK